MKRIFTLALTLILAASLWGCSRPTSGQVSFYYCWDSSQRQYFEEESLIHGEFRDVTGHQDDLRYIVGLYLAGPMEEGLISPFPKTVRLLSARYEEETVIIELSDHCSSMSDSRFTLACCCLTMTCSELTPCQEVTVVSGNRSLTIQTDSILLSDALPQQETNGGQ